MQRVNQLGYIGFGVSDMNAWANFSTQVLGLQRADDDENALQRYRMDEYRNRVLVYQDDADDLGFLGWEVDSKQALYAMAEQLRAAGVQVTPASKEEAELRKVTELMRFEDVNGVTSELYYGAELAFEAPFHSPRTISGFVTGEQGIGHAVLSVEDLDASMRFYCDVLGMRESDYITISRGGMSFDIGFLHCNPRHHTIALAEGNRPKRLLHLMLQVDALDDVGSTYYLCQAENVPLASTMGRHTNDHMLSFYMQSPSGFEIEYGWGARTIDDATWKVQKHNVPSIWGHKRS